VVKLLNKLHIELTKSRSRQSNDNALAESKNGSTIIKILGYSHIPQCFAAQVNEFNRPCFFPHIIVDDKGKERKKYRYEDMKTPYEKLKSLDNAKQCLKEGITFKKLDADATTISDNEAARQWQAARTQLFNTIFGRKKQTG
jgi:hypothetical protein